MFYQCENGRIGLKISEHFSRTLRHSSQYGGYCYACVRTCGGQQTFKAKHTINLKICLFLYYFMLRQLKNDIFSFPLPLVYQVIIQTAKESTLKVANTAWPCFSGSLPAAGTTVLNSEMKGGVLPCCSCWRLIQINLPPFWTGAKKNQDPSSTGCQTHFSSRAAAAAQ